MTERHLEVFEASVVEPAYTKTQFDANFLEPDAKVDEYREVTDQHRFRSDGRGKCPLR